MDQNNQTVTTGPRKVARPYKRPHLQVYGDIRQITQNLGAPTKHDNPTRSGTHLGNGKQ